MGEPDNPELPHVFAAAYLAEAIVAELGLAATAAGLVEPEKSQAQTRILSQISARIAKQK